ncbi:MAG: AAA family ATPase [Anaerovoracaceae bacterium]
MNVSADAAAAINGAFELAVRRRYEYVTPELLLLALCRIPLFFSAAEDCGASVENLQQDLEGYLKENMEMAGGVEPNVSIGFTLLLASAQQSAISSGNEIVDLTHICFSFWNLKDSYAVYFLEKQGIHRPDLLRAMNLLLSEDPEEDDFEEEAEGSARAAENLEAVTAFAPCINEMLGDVNPLIGREEELERTIQILCRRDKNNPLHLGEPGVGKTAITYGLAQRINDGQVPEPLQGARIYALDLGSLIAGTQYRGDYEKRLKKLLDQLEQEDRPIVYIDEIHNLTGAGAVGGNSMDAGNILKPYLAQGHIRFIGATTFDEYKKYFEKSRSLARRFQNVEIKEPTEEETVRILQGLKKKYEEFHGVTYNRGVIEYAVSMSVRYINDRFLPDKAIDLMDEAGAWRRIHPLDQKRQSVGKDVIDKILTSVCRIPVETVARDEISGLSTLEARIRSQVFGQDPAVTQVVNAVKYSKAGLIPEGKPLASLLFAGPTGVGKTEIARVLAKELGVPLVRFDMSEYGEKHSVAKLIGAPAGYVGYEEGGLLTEAIRKNPSAVLLLDEIEKAHPDIYSTLLQVMDYATLTDNQGRKADFRNVIIIMTSNAGASRIGKPGLGFNASDTTSDAIMEEVKRVFQPEFRNRLSQIVVFKGMDEAMADSIAGKKLRELQDMLQQRRVELTVRPEALRLLSEKGISREYGAREMDRILQNQIKPLFVDEMLFGPLKKGGRCLLTVSGDAFAIESEKSSRSPRRKGTAASGKQPTGAGHSGTKKAGGASEAGPASEA